MMCCLESARLGLGQFRTGAIERIVVIVVVFLLLVAAGVVFLVVSYESNSGRPKAAVVLGTSTGDCGQVSFHVQNQDTRILHGWSVIPVISPTDPHFQTSPSSFLIETLGPRGNSTEYVFNVSLSGAPPGVYDLRLELVNGSASIATSPTLSCKV